MKGYLVVNHFLHLEKFDELYQYFMESAKRLDIDLVKRTNVECMTCLGKQKEKEPNIDFVLFWDKDILLAKVFEARGYSVYNRPSAIEICDSKALTHIALERGKIPMPKTFLMPMTYENIGYNDTSFLARIEEELGYPMVVKESFGSFGQQVYLCKNRKDVEKHIGREVIFQEFVESSFGRDIRLQVVGDKVIAGMYRYTDNGDFRANLSNGGKMKPYTYTNEQEELAVACVKAIGLDFAGVDILFGLDDSPLVCEVNSNAHFKNILVCTGVNTADAILEYIKEREAAK